MTVNAQTAPCADGHWWSLFKLGSVTYKGIGRAEKLSLFWSFERALGQLATRAKILSLVRYHDVEGYVRDLRRMDEEAVHDDDAFGSYCDLVAQTLSHRAPYDREQYLSVRLEGSRRRYEDIDELVAREAGRGPGGPGAAASYAALVLCAAMTIAYDAVLRLLGVLAGPV